MKKANLIISAMVTSSLLATSACAEFYIGVKGGLALAPDSDVSYSHSNNPTDSETDALSFDTSYALGAVVGYGFEAFPIRIEGELYYQRNDADKYTDKNSGETGDDFDLGFENTGVMASLYYDFVNSSDFTPYVGAGLGYSEVKTYGKDSLASGTSQWSESKVDGKGLAWQISSGVSYRINEHFLLDLSYRYYVSDGFTYTNHDFDSSDPGGHIDFDYEVHTILFGLRYSF